MGTHRSAGDNFGSAVSVYGNTAVIGAMFHAKDSAGGNIISNAGAAYVFERNASGNWLQVKKITPADRSSQAYFGTAISIYQNNFAVGAYFEGLNSTGAVYTYQKVNGSWNYLQKLTSLDKQLSDCFGRSVSLHKNYLMVGAYGQDYDLTGSNMLNSAGAAYFFVKKNSTWNQQQKLIANDRAAGDIFGFSVAIYNDQIAIGSYFNKLDSSSLNSLNNAGALYTFQTCIPSVTSVAIKICKGDSALIFGKYQKTDGVYSDTLTSYLGCDSIVNITLVIKQPFYSLQTKTSCSSYVWNNTTYTKSGTYKWNGTNANGCDSIATLDLKINSPATGTDTRSECRSFKWIDGKTYTSNNNTATFSIAGGAANGCDSLVTLNLTIKNVTDLSTTVNGNTITANDTAALYYWLDCDNSNTIVIGGTGRSLSVPKGGNYAVQLIENGCVDTSDCVIVNTFGITNNTFAQNTLIQQKAICS